MAWTPVLRDKFGPGMTETEKKETWDVTAAAADVGAKTIQARYVMSINDVLVDSFGGTGPTSVTWAGSIVTITLPGTASATSYRVEIRGKF